MDLERLAQRTGNAIGTIAQTVVPESVQRVAAHLLKDSVLSDTLFDRGYNSVGAFVARAAGREFVPLTPEELAYKERVGDFLDPSVELGVDEQLGVMDEFYNCLGYTPPALDESKKLEIQKVLDENPGTRVVPTPLLSKDGRIALAESGRKLPAQQLNPKESALWVPQGGLYGKPLKDEYLTSVVFDENDPNAYYALGYKTPDSQIVDREQYAASLLEAGQAIEDEHGILWTYPVTDVRLETTRTETTAEELHTMVDPIMSPELLIVTQLLYQANGTLDQAWQFDFANEAVYKYDRWGSAEHPMLKRVAMVVWEEGYHYIALRGVDADPRTNERNGVRFATSGLGASVKE